MKNVIFIANTSWYLWNFRRATIEKMLINQCNVNIISVYDDYSKDLDDYNKTLKKK